MNMLNAATCADLVLKNGWIYTHFNPLERVEAVAISGKHIVYVGQDQGVAGYIGSHTRVIDLEGRMVLPAFVDAHMHPVDGACRYLYCLSLYDTQGDDLKAVYLESLDRYVRENPEMTWINGAGFNRAAFDSIGPRKEWLDQIEKTRPVTILSRDGHSIWANSKALEVAGITAETHNPPNGIIKRDPQSGEPTGLLQESAMNLVVPHIPRPTKDEVKAALLWLQKWLNREGITTAFDAMLEIDAPEVSAAYDELAREGLLTVRYRGAWFIRPNRDYRADIDRAVKLSTRFTHPHFKTDVFKFFADEVIEEETGFLVEPYAHRTDEWRGIKNWENEILRDAFERVHQAGSQVHVHTIGDGAVGYVLDVLEELKEQSGQVQWSRRPTLAHVQMVSPTNFGRMAEMDVTAVIAPYWAIIEDYFWQLFLPYLGPERAFMGQYPQKSFLNNGVNVAIHSDFPVDEPSSMEALYRAMKRCLSRTAFECDFGSQSGYRYCPEPEGELQPGDFGALPPEEERLALEEVLQAYTMGGAYANFLENELGSIEPGKLADLIILDRNLFSLDTEEIPQVRVSKTIFEGRIVFETDSALT